MPYSSSYLAPNKRSSHKCTRWHHISKANPSIEHNPYKESHHWSNHLVSTYCAPGRDSSQMSLGESSLSKVSTPLKHIPPQSRCSFTCFPSLCIFSTDAMSTWFLKNGPCEHNSGGSGFRLTILGCLGLQSFLRCRMFGVKNGAVMVVGQASCCVLQKWTMILATTQQGKRASDWSENASKAVDWD